MLKQNTVDRSMREDRENPSESALFGWQVCKLKTGGSNFRERLPLSLKICDGIIIKVRSESVPNFTLVSSNAQI